MDIASQKLYEFYMSIHLDESANLNPEDIYTQKELHYSIEKCLNTLPPRARSVIEFLFMEDRTFDEVAIMFGVSRERIRQIRETALGMLRHPARARRLSPYLFPDLSPEKVGRMPAIRPTQLKKRGYVKSEDYYGKRKEQKKKIEVARQIKIATSREEAERNSEEIRRRTWEQFVKPGVERRKNNLAGSG